MAINNSADTLNAPLTFDGSPFTINSAVIGIGTSASATTISGSLTLPTLGTATSANILYYNSGTITYGSVPIVSPAWLLNGMNTGGAGAYLLGTSDASDGWGMQSAGTQFFTVSASQAVTFTTSSISIVSPIINIGNTGTPAIQIGNLNSGTSLALKGDTVLTDGHTSWACDSPTITIGATAASSINISNVACATTLDGTTLKIPNLPSATSSDVIFYNSTSGALSYGATPTGPAGWLTNGSNTGAGLILGNADGNSWSMQSNSTVFFTVDGAQNITETPYTYTMTANKGISITSNTSGLAFTAADTISFSSSGDWTAAALGFIFNPYTGGFAVNGSGTSGGFNVSMPSGVANIYGYYASSYVTGTSLLIDSPTLNLGTSAATSISFGSSISTIFLPSLAAATSANILFYNASSGQISYGTSPSVTTVASARSPDFSLVASTAQLVGGGHSQNTFVFTHSNGIEYALVSAGGTTGTIELYNISNPLAPVLVNSGNYSGTYNATAVVISGSTYAFIPSSGASTFIIVNITNPAVWSTVVTKTVTGTAGSVYSGVYANGYYYCATQHNGLTVFDCGGGLAGGTLAVPVQSYQEGGAVQSFGVAISGNYLYTTQYTTSVYTTRQIKSWNLTGAGTLAVPSLIQSLQVTTVGEALGISLSGNTAFVTTIVSGTYAVNLVDITTPSAMTNLSVVTPSYTLNSAYVGVASGNYLFVPSGSNATNGGAIDMFDISNRSAPIKVDTTYSGVANDVFGGIAINGGYIYVGTYGISAQIGPFDVFTMPQLTPVLGTAVGSSLTLKNLPSTTGPVVTVSSSGELGTAAGIITAPVSSSTSTAAFGSSLTLGTAVQNTLGYDILLNISVSVTAATTATLVLGVGPTSSPTTNAVTGAFTSLVTLPPINFTAIVPNNYYVLVNTTGTITIASIVCEACAI